MLFRIIVPKYSFHVTVVVHGRQNNEAEKRIRALEGKTIADPVVLYFADGGTQEIRGSIDFLMSLLGGLGDKASLSFTQVRNWIRSVGP